MSVVLVAGMENFIVFMSDGRVTRDNGAEKIIVKEDYKKLHRINNDVCIGYIGSGDICEGVVKALNNYNKAELDLISTANISYAYAKELYRVYKEELGKDYQVTMVVGGKAPSGNIEFYLFGSKQDFKINSFKPRGAKLSHIMMHSDRADSETFVKHLEKNQPFDSFNQYYKAMGECIDEVASMDCTVNTIKFKEEIRL